jgi:DNA-binding beta-propeller fold protein YncE
LRAVGPVVGLRLITAGPRDVWAASYGGTLSRIDADAGRVTATVFIGRQIAGVAPGPRAVWVATVTGDVLRIDPTTGRIAKKLSLGVYAPHQSTTMAIGGGNVWILALER